MSLIIEVTANLAERERDTVMLGRTHGQAAVPITFGLKIAVFVDEFRRHLIRLDELESRAITGKFLGAVGTGAAQGENEVQEGVVDRFAPKHTLLQYKLNIFMFPKSLHVR